MFNEFGKFFLVGALTTTVDFIVFNSLTSKYIRWGRIKANVISCTIAMAFSFAMNRTFVFRNCDGDWVSAIGKFVAVTAFSSYGLQNFVLWFSERPLWCGFRPAVLNECNPLGRFFRSAFIKKNTAKALAVGAGLIWNYTWYRLFVFKL